MDQQRGAELAGNSCGFPGLRRGVGRDAGIQRTPGAHCCVQRHHGLLDGGFLIEAVAVEDVDVVQAEPGQGLVQGGQHILARTAALPVGAGPHVPPRFGGDHQFVAQACEVVAQVRAHVLLGPTVRRAVVVRQVEVGHSTVECAAQDRPVGLLGTVVTEVLPQPQGQRRQLEPALTAEPVFHRLVAVFGRLVITHGVIVQLCEGGAQTAVVRSSHRVVRRTQSTTVYYRIARHVVRKVGWWRRMVDVRSRPAPQAGFAPIGIRWSSSQ